MRPWQFSVTVGLLAWIIFQLYMIHNSPQTVVNKTENYAVQKIYFTRELVNDSISRKIKVGQFNDVLEIYLTICKDPEIISMIIFKDLEKGIPINLDMALVEQESGFNPKAINIQKDENGKIISKDIGLRQISMGLAKKLKLKEAELWNVGINNETGAQHLLDKFKQFKTWEEAIMRYNGSGDKAVVHLAAVLKRERDIDRLYNSY